METWLVMVRQLKRGQRRRDLAVFLLFRCFSVGRRLYKNNSVTLVDANHFHIQNCVLKYRQLSVDSVLCYLNILTFFDAFFCQLIRTKPAEILLSLTIMWLVNILEIHFCTNMQSRRGGGNTHHVTPAGCIFFMTEETERVQFPLNSYLSCVDVEAQSVKLG